MEDKGMIDHVPTIRFTAPFLKTRSSSIRSWNRLEAMLVLVVSADQVKVEYPHPTSSSCPRAIADWRCAEVGTV
jgi:hypothetical protein